MLIKTDTKEDGGLFRVFAAADFFSDRAIKSVSEIHLELNKYPACLIIFVLPGNL